MEPFATVDDYEARYGDVEDPERVGVLLGDASALIRGVTGLIIREDDEVQAANLKRIACAVVHRSIAAGEWDGLSQVSQTAGSYTASASVANPGAALFLTSEDKRSLLYGVGRIGQTNPYSSSRLGGEP